MHEKGTCPRLSKRSHEGSDPCQTDTAFYAVKSHVQGKCVTYCVCLFTFPLLLVCIMPSL